MDSQLHGNHLSKVIVLVRTFLTLKGCGMIVSRRRLRWNQRPTRKVVTRTFPYSVRQIRAEVKDTTRVRKRVKSQPHSQERRT
jgi:hypothetical protein